MFELAAELLEQRGLCRTQLYGHYSSSPRVTGISVVGAIKSACFYLDAIPAIVAHVQGLARFAGVDRAPQVEEGRKKAEVVALLQDCARATRALR